MNENFIFGHEVLPHVCNKIDKIKNSPCQKLYNDELYVYFTSSVCIFNISANLSPISWTNVLTISNIETTL